MSDAKERALMAYGWGLLARASRAKAKPLGSLYPALAPQMDVAWEAYQSVLASEGEREPESLLTCVFSLIRAEGEQPTRRYLRPQPQALTREALFPAGKEEVESAGPQLWDGFMGEFEAVAGMEAGVRFEAFHHLYWKYAWAVPCAYGEPGVSLFEQWKAVAALVFASGEEWPKGPAEAFTLIGGDIPGIQDFVYTITSKGAAKGLRGRSFFIQLLVDAVVRRLLADLDLRTPNIVYNAGGNFLVLAQGDSDVEEVVARVKRHVDRGLVDALQGETALVLEAMEVLSVQDLFMGDRFRPLRDRLGRRVAQAKNRPLRELAANWETLFEPRGKGSRLSCAVCRIEVDLENSESLEPSGELPGVGEAAGVGETPRICPLCRSFSDLARVVGHKDLWMIVDHEPTSLGITKKGKDGWSTLLARMTGFRYSFDYKKPSSQQGLVLVFNQPDFLQVGACGFRFQALTTPLVSEVDRRRLRDDEGWDEAEIPEVDQIRSFAILAKAARWAGALERVGVLLMDVDGLGHMFSAGIPDLTLPRLSALSGALEVFFGGYLDELVSVKSKGDLYVIYAGGDDLFIVGAWHHLPDLAEAIRNEFKAFTGDHPAMSLSGGLTLESAHFPLYQAAERAKAAESRAKAFTRDGRKKDALCFLDTAVGWEDWALIREQKDDLLWLIGEDGENRSRPEGEREQRLPRALLQVVQTVFQIYRSGLVEARRLAREGGRPLPDPRLFYGRWTWMQAYSLTRMARRGEKRLPEARERIEGLQRSLLRPEAIRYAGLAARWAEYLARGSTGPERSPTEASHEESGRS